MPQITLPFNASKLAQQNMISSSRVGLVFTYTLGLDSEGNDPTRDAGTSIRDQTVLGRLNRQGVNINIPGVGVARELITGAGWKSARVEQQINVTQEGALGFYEIVETIEHNVAANRMTAQKVAMRWGLLSNIGLAPYGVETLTSPLLNCYIFDPKELQRGNDVGYLRAEQLHIETNGIDFNTGQTVMENVNFRPNRLRRVNNPIPAELSRRLAQLFPEVANDFEIIPDSFTFESI